MLLPCRKACTETALQAASRLLSVSMTPNTVADKVRVSGWSMAVLRKGIGERCRERFRKTEASGWLL